METILGEKPYDFVPLTNKTARDKDSRHDAIINDGEHYSGKITLRIKALSPIHIFSGAYGEMQGEGLVKTFCRAGSIPVIPGSSVKGVIRSIVEAVANCCAPELPRKASFKLDTCLPQETRVKCSDYTSLCPACKIFGFTNGGKDENRFKGLVSFSEFKPIDDVTMEVVKVPGLNEPFKDYPKNVGIGNERLYYCTRCDQNCYACSKDYFLKISNGGKFNGKGRFRGRKFYFHGANGHIEAGPEPHEAASAGTVFEGSVIFENLTKGELSVLAFALGFDGGFKHKIGYAKPAYLGSAEFSLVKCECLNARYGLPGKGLMPDLILLAEEYGKLDGDRGKAIRKLKEIWAWPGKGKPWRVGQGGARIY